MGAMAERSIDIRILKIKPENFAELIALIYSNRVNSTNAQKILAEMLDSGVDMDPTHIMEDKGYGQISDPGKIDAVVAEVIKNYPKQVGEFKAGKEPIIKFLIGMAMKATEGAADPAAVEKALREALKS
jgi:aspartyl-tRNA(Asn)/glutamyl-tRNA(Gln) amidotransferase subunit B